MGTGVTDVDWLDETVCKLSTENGRLRAACERMMVGGNHLATYRDDRWPDYKLDGLTREQQADSALRILGAGREYDMWCCWSAIMQARDYLSSDEQASHTETRQEKNEREMAEGTRCDGRCKEDGSCSC